MNESPVTIKFVNPVAFPQPEVEAPKFGAQIWIVSDGDVCDRCWTGEKYDQSALATGNIYLTRELAEKRAAWNAQQMAKLVRPLWLRKLGPDVQVNFGDGWEDLNTDCCIDWSRANPAMFRAKPRDVVVTVNGKEYRWPPTVTAGEPRGDRYRLAYDTGVYLLSGSSDYGSCVHHTRAAAEQQLAAIRAAAGES